MKLSEMDIVYIYKHTMSEELKYSLRSLKNIPHRNVIVSGDREPWFSDKIIHLPRPNQSPHRRYYGAGGSKYNDAEQNLLRALRYENMSDNFILFNDDFFVMKPVQKLPDFNIGTLQETIDERLERTGETPYVKAIKSTKLFLENLQIRDPLNYSLHVPVVMGKSQRMAVSKLISGNSTNVLLARTVYGNLFIEKSNKVSDSKVYDNDTILDDTFISTDEKSFINGNIGEYIRSEFKEASQYEKELEG